MTLKTDIEFAQSVAEFARETSCRNLATIAIEINAIYFQTLAKTPGKVPAWVTYTSPYRKAMRELDTITDRYGLDSAYEIVLRFLANATSWRGPDARRIKAELNEILASCPDDKHL